MSKRGDDQSGSNPEPELVGLFDRTPEPNEGMLDWTGIVGWNGEPDDGQLAEPSPVTPTASNDTPATEGQSEADTATAGATKAAGATQVAARTSASEPGDPIEGEPVLTHELADAIKDVLARHRHRVAEDLERRRQERVEQIRAADAAEEERLRQAAADEAAAIAAWAEAETQRIRREAEERGQNDRERLEARIASNRAAVDAAIEDVERTIEGHRRDVERYFEDLERETDPMRLVRDATRQPAFPSLDPPPADSAAPANTAPLADSAPLAGSAPLGDSEPLAERAPLADRALLGDSTPPPSPAEPAPWRLPANPNPASRPETFDAGRAGSVPLLPTMPVVRPKTLRLGGEPGQDEVMRTDDNRTPSPVSRVGGVLSRFDRRRTEGPPRD